MPGSSATPLFVQALIASVLLACFLVILVGSCYVAYFMLTKPPPRGTYIYEPVPIRKYP